MSTVQHISMRVPWRDRPWDDKVCVNPINNSSCLLLKGIGSKRDDAWEAAVAGQSFDDVGDYSALPCLSERGTFMSSSGYTLEKEHPYRFNKALKGHLLPTPLSVPPFAFEALPFRWLSRKSVDEGLWQLTDEYRPEREDAARQAIGFRPNWLMDGRNQRAMIQRFFEDVVDGQSLVLMYLKHSPLQDETTRRLLVGAAMVDQQVAPRMWEQSGSQPFDSSMWETIVSHSLRPDQRRGILLPYQQLVDLMETGVDVRAALAWAPEDADVEFSYVTDHVSDDTAIAALKSLQAAAEGMAALGLTVPVSATSWVDQQVERLWQIRGPAPGLAAVLAYIGAEYPHHVVRRLVLEPDWAHDPWGVVERALMANDPLAKELASRLPPSVGHSWRGRAQDEQNALKILSAMDVGHEQVSCLMTGKTTTVVSAEELVSNPYYAATCTYRSQHPIALTTVDQACFPATHVDWTNLIADLAGLDDPGDCRRLEALMVEVLERLAEQGDTIASEAEVLTAASEISLTRPCPICQSLLVSYQLDAPHLDEYSYWTRLVAAELQDGLPAYKLEHLSEAGTDISEYMCNRREAPRFSITFEARPYIDKIFGEADKDDTQEHLAREEKAAGLEELFASRLSVLVGPAGTGKTRLLEALVNRDEIMQDGVLLLAPTGKARVQMQTKVGHPARTLASFLIKKGGFDFKTGRYCNVPKSKRERYGLVIIDEASMLTEEMLAATLSALQGVKRLILVGDYRQLPPIGAGRPFVDIVEWLKPESLPDTVRVAPGYVELTVFRRFRSVDAERDDLALARWFGGGDLPGAADAIWQKARLGINSETLALRPWGEAGIAVALQTAIEDELGLADAPDPEWAFKLTYGGKVSDDGKYVNWYTGDDGAGKRCEDWQVLSPTRSRAFGTVEINRMLKHRYRSGDLKWAMQRYGKRPPRPLGPEQIVLGDKVMQTKNDGDAKGHPEGVGLDYVANGEIGVVVSRASANPQYANVEFSSQTGITYGYKPSSSEDPPLELAWAVTVHKSQGSEFGTTFLVMPARVTISRELLYTALTRQTRKVVILHEGSVDDLFALTSPAYSETARRMTDLFRKPEPRELTVGDGLRRFDANLIHVAPGDVLVRSKNEVIVAAILEELAPDRWSYEAPLTIDGVTKYPDFTIENDDTGEAIIWEHLGMMGNQKYADDWETKKEWYARHGFRPYDDPDAKGDRGVLMWTDDRGGVNQPAWADLARTVIGSPAPRRRPAKRAPGKRP